MIYQIGEVNGVYELCELTHLSQKTIIFHNMNWPIYLHVVNDLKW